MTAHEIHGLLDNQLCGLSTPWEGSLLFKKHPRSRIYDTSEILSLLKNQSQPIEICHFIGGKNPDIEKLHFVPSLNHPPENVQWSNLYKPWVILRGDLEVVAIAWGNTFISSSGGISSKNKNTIRQFHCRNCYCLCQKSCIEPTLCMPHRKSSSKINRILEEKQIEMVQNM